MTPRKFAFLANGDFSYGYRITAAQISLVFSSWAYVPEEDPADPLNDGPEVGLAIVNLFRLFLDRVPLNLDCQGMARVIMGYAVLQDVQPGEYDGLFYGCVPTEKRYVASPADAKIGDWLYFRNQTDKDDNNRPTGHRGYRYWHTEGGYTGENVIKVGPDAYWGWPSQETRTAEGWRKKLKDEYNAGHKGVDEIDTIPDNIFFNNKAEFISIAKVRLALTTGPRFRELALSMNAGTALFPRGVLRW